MRPTGIARGGLALLLLMSAGCASWSTSPSMSQPFFIVDQSDARTFHMLAKKQDTVATRCQEHNSCDHAYFTRALIGLYESRDVAIRYFEKVIAVAPRGQLAASSRLWLEQIQQHPAPVERSWFTSVMSAPAISVSQVTLAQTSDRLVRDLLDREMMIQQLRASKDADAQTGKKDPGKGGTESTNVQVLQRQLSERDKKIDELSNQLEALKRIDQEMRDKVRPIRPPSTMVPPPSPEPINP